MSTCTLPENIIPLSPNGFMFSILKLPELSYFSQEVSVPSLSLPIVEVATPFSFMETAGNILNYSPLTVTFVVDEDMANYLAISNWMIALGFPENYEQYISLLGVDTVSLDDLAKHSSDGTLQILSSNNIPVQTVTFVDLVPTDLGELTFSSTNDDVNYITCSATFQYSYYTFQ